MPLHFIPSRRDEFGRSRIPTPVNYPSGRKSATGVLYHDSMTSRAALQSNVEGVSSHEMRKKEKKSFHDVQERQSLDLVKNKNGIDESNRDSKQKQIIKEQINARSVLRN